MTTYITTPAAHTLGHWLAALAVSLVLLALAYAQAPDPAGYLGLRAPSARTHAHSRPTPDGQRGHRRAVGQAAPALASTQVGPPAGRASDTQFTR